MNITQKITTKPKLHHTYTGGQWGIGSPTMEITVNNLSGNKICNITKNTKKILIINMCGDSVTNNDMANNDMANNDMGNKLYYVIINSNNINNKNIIFNNKPIEYNEGKYIDLNSSDTLLVGTEYPKDNDYSKRPIYPFILKTNLSTLEANKILREYSNNPTYDNEYARITTTIDSESKTLICSNLYIDPNDIEDDLPYCIQIQPRYIPISIKGTLQTNFNIPVVITFTNNSLADIDIQTCNGKNTYYTKSTIKKSDGIKHYTRTVVYGFNSNASDYGEPVASWYWGNNKGSDSKYYIKIANMGVSQYFAYKKYHCKFKIISEQKLNFESVFARGYNNLKKANKIKYSIVNDTSLLDIETDLFSSNGLHLYNSFDNINNYNCDLYFWRDEAYLNSGYSYITIDFNINQIITVSDNDNSATF